MSQSLSPLSTEKPLPGETIAECIARLSQDPDILYVEPNYIRYIQEIPNDPYYSEQWALDLLEVTKAWDVPDGQALDLTVAVLDTGVDYNHPEFAERLLQGKDFINGDDDPRDDHGHGTRMIGNIIAAANNQIGIAGIVGAASVKILPVKVLDSSGQGEDSLISQGIRWAADQGAKVINLSLGGPEYGLELENAINYGISKGSLIVAAAGNDSLAEIYYPARFDEVLGITATNPYDQLAYYSNYGTETDLAAPGSQIRTTNINGGYSTGNGTSFSSAIVSGVAALIWSEYPEYTAQQIKAILKAGVKDLGTPGYDLSFGYGRINAYHSMLQARLLAPFNYQDLINTSQYYGQARPKYDYNLDGIIDILDLVVVSGHLVNR